MAPTPALVALLAVTAFAAGFVDAIGGGGGLLTVPALFGVGLSPHLALGSNKGQSCFGAASSLYTYFRERTLHRERIGLGLAGGFVGACAGASLLMLIPARPLKPLVLVLLVSAGCIIVFRDRFARPAEHVRRPKLVLFALSAAIGAYDGFFGPGTGSLLIAAFMHWFGDTPTQASGNAKIVNFASNVTALALFQYRGLVLWKLALPMGIANVIGARLGARLAIRHGDRVVRAVVVIALAAIAVKVAVDTFSARS